MLHLTPLSLFALLTAVTCLLLGLLIGICGKTKLHKIWALFQLSVGGWGALVFLSTLSDDPNTAYDLWRFSHLFGVYISIFFFHSTCLFCNLSYPGLIRASYLYGLLNNIMHTANNGHFLFKKEHVKYLFDSVYYPQAHAFNFLIVLTPWIFLTLFSMYHLYRYSKTHEDNTGHQAKLWLIISIFGYTGGCSTFLPMFGINLYPTALPLLPSYALMQTYAIFKYQLFNLKIVVEKSIVYSLLIAVVSIAYLAIVLTTEKVLQSLIGYKSMAVSLSAAFIIGIIVIPLRNRIQFLLDRSLFKGTQPEIAAENELLRKEVTQSEKHKAVAALASGIAHEVRNPLTALKAFYEHFPQKKDDPEFLAKFTHIAGKEIGRIEGLIQQLLDFAKPSPPSFHETDINGLIEDTLALLSNKLHTHNITLDYHPSPVNYHLKVDQNQIKQALLNILLNAVDAMPTGGHLSVTTTIHHSLFTIHIKDTGSGIAPDDLKHIFEPFFSKKASGTGLGLAITRGIIEEHDGKIKVTSTVNEGTTFTIELPIKP